MQPNPRGSTGYGQKFIDEINGDWGGKPYDDIMTVVDAVAAQPYIDNTRMAAAGASYGGYMVNWINGHTNRFKAIVSHGGVFDLASWSRETEEQWFPLWEMKGTAVDNPDLYEKFSPSTYARDFKTPTLVIHGEQDFRDVTGQGLQLFTVLQQAKNALETAALPRRRPLDPEAAKQPALVSHRPRLDRRVDQEVARSVSRYSGKPTFLRKASSRGSPRSSPGLSRFTRFRTQPIRIGPTPGVAIQCLKNAILVAQTCENFGSFNVSSRGEHFLRLVAAVRARIGAAQGAPIPLLAASPS